MIRAFTIILVEIFRSRMALGNLNDAQIMVRTYFLPDLVMSSGPMQCTITWLNDSSKIDTPLIGSLFNTPTMIVPGTRFDFILTLCRAMFTGLLPTPWMVIRLHRFTRQTTL